MKNTQKLTVVLLLGALSISSTFPADHQQIALNEYSLYQRICTFLSNVTPSLSNVTLSSHRTYNTIKDAIKNDPTKATYALGLFVAMVCSESPRISNAANSSFRLYNRIKGWTKDNPIKALCACCACSVLFSSGCLELMTYYRNKHALGLILEDPEVALNHLSIINDQFESAFKTEKLDDCAHPDDQALAKLTSLIQSYEQESPICLLGECTASDCPLTRSCQPKYREEFETRVVGQLVAKLKSCDETVQYVSFGSGGMYQDLVILCKTLTSEPNASLSMHLIDLQNKCFTDMRDTIELDYQVKSDTYTDLSLNMEEIIKHTREQIKFFKEKPDHEIKKNIQITYASTENKARQFIAFLQKSFPDAELSLHLHNSNEAYLHYIATYKRPYPDVVCAADITTDNLSDKAYKDYISLSDRVLKNKPESNNTLLAQNIFGDKEKAKSSLITVSLHETDEAKQRELNLFPDKTGKYRETIKAFLKIDEI